MEQKTQLQTTIVIKEEVTDTDINFPAKEDSVDQRLDKVTNEESSTNPKDHCYMSGVTKIERNGSLSPSPPSSSPQRTGTNSRNRRSPKCPLIMPISQSASIPSPISNSTTKQVARNLLTTPNSDSTSRTLAPHTALNNTNNNLGSESEHAQMLTSKNLCKIRRLLSTLLQFAKMFNTEVAETVKNLIFNLACSAIGVEEFHNHLQEAITDFPLRPFVLPFLRSYVPLLQKEVNLQAKLTKQNIQLYVRQNENSILDPFCSPSDMNDVFNQMVDSVTSSNQRNDIFSNNFLMRKRRYECFENNGSYHRMDPLTDSRIHETSPPPLKKQTPPTVFSRNINHPVVHNNTNHQQPSYHPGEYFQTPLPPPFLSAENSWLPTSTPASSTKDCHANVEDKKSAENSEWDNINTMLNCILSMVEKTKKALAILQDRNTTSDHSGGDVGGTSSKKSTSDHDSRSKSNAGDEVKKTINQLMAQTMRLTEERVAFVLRKAEEAVNEVKHRAILEFQKALATADSGGNVLKIPHESKQMTAVVTDSQSEFSTRSDFPIDDKLRDPSALFYPFLQTNSCWNCGQKAEDKDNGPNLSKYCGPL